MKRFETTAVTLRNVSIILLLMVAGTSVFAQNPNSVEKRIALVIGNAAYIDSIPSLKNPVNDANDISVKLQELGWSVIASNDTTRSDMISKISEFRDLLKASPGATAMFFYAGYAVQVNGKNFLLPVGEPFGSLDNVRERAISVDRINEAFLEAKALRTLVILDACRENPFTQKTRTIFPTRGLSVMPVYEFAKGGSAVIFATMPNDVTAEGEGRNGVFTSSLLSYIDQGYNLQDLYLKVKNDVRIKTSGLQNPSITSTGVLSGFYFGSASTQNSSAPVSQPASAPLTVLATETFRLRVPGQVADMSVKLDGKDIGKTPLDITLPKGIYSLELTHPDWNAWKEVIQPNAAEIVDISPVLDRSDSWKLASLTTQRNDLQASIESIKSRQKVPKIITLSSLGVTVLGLATSTVAYFAGNSLRDTYNSATTISEAASARSQIDDMTITFQVGIIAGGTGLAGALLSFFMTPSTRELDTQITSLNDQIKMLGGAK